MRKLVLLLAFFSSTAGIVLAQSVANYTAVRTTATGYSSIAAFGTVVPSWRGQSANQNDDNRSNPVAIGFDFWYCGTRYTHCNISINGFIDFSTSLYNGNYPLGGDPNSAGSALCGGFYSYREQGSTLWQSPTCGTGVPPNSFDGTYWAIAAMYCDLWPPNGTNALAYSIKYSTIGVAPNRTFVVKYINMDDWSSPGTSDYNFQIRLSETSGVIQLVYGSMFAAPGSPTPYSCGINQRIFTNPPAASELLTQQGSNSNTFNNTIPALSTIMPTANSTITFTPVCPVNPGGALTFSGVGNTTMTLNWADWAANEMGYVIYYSTDGVNYFFQAQTAANATSYAATNLSQPTYWWKVYAVTEGCMSLPLSNSQATVAGGVFFTIASGNWSNGAIWNAGTVPTIGDNATISNGHTVAIDVNNAGCFTLTVNTGGAASILNVGNTVTNYTFNILSDLTIGASGTFRANPAFAATHTINMSGNIINNGIINMRPGVTALANINFIKNGNQTISGTALVNNNSYNLIVLNMGAIVTNTLEVTASNFSAPANFLTMQNGTFKFSVPVAAVTLDLFTSIATIPYTCGLWMNSPSSTMIAHSTLNFQGAINCSAGTLNVGDVADEMLMSDGAVLTVSGGNLNVSGRLDRPSYVAITHVNISNGTLTLNTIGSTSTTNAPYMVDVIGSSLNMSGGSIVIRREGGGGAQDLGYINTGCQLNYSITGGTLRIGDGSTPVTQRMRINTNIPIANLLINPTNSPTGTLITNDLTVNNTVTISVGGTLNANTRDMFVGGHWTNNGTFQQQTRRVTFNGSTASTQNITGTTATTFYDLTINATGTGGVTQVTGATVSNTATFTAGRYVLGTTTLTITNAAIAAVSRTAGWIVSENTGNLGKVQWNMGSTTGAHLFPFGTSTGVYIPFTFNLTAGTPSNVTISTYGTVASNLPWPTAPTLVTNLNSWTGLLPDNRDATANRFWQIDKTGGSGTATLTFSYDPATELPIAPYNLAADQRAQRWESTLSQWQQITFGQTTTANSVTVPGITTFSPWALASQLSPLPIELVEFGASCANGPVLIEWITASESNNDFFSVERTADGITFEPVGIVDGAGTTSQQRSYSLVDEMPLEGTSFYRLKQTDFDGAQTFSNLAPVECELNGSLGISVFPNPTTGESTFIQVKTEAETTVSLSVVNAIGERLFYTTVKTDKNGMAIVPLELNADMSTGIYMVNAITEQQKFSTKMLVK